MRTARRNNRRAFALVEVLVAVVFIGMFVMALMQVRNQMLHEFIKSSDQHTGAWLAELKMAELISQELPDPQDEENTDTWVMSGDGDFGYLDERMNEINSQINEDWSDREGFEQFRYEWTKELIFIGPNFIGTDLDLEDYEQPVDEYGELLDEDDPRTQPAARVVRITLIVTLPDRKGDPEDSEAEARRDLENTIKLVTYVDPSSLYSIREEAAEETPPEQPPEEEQ